MTTLTADQFSDLYRNHHRAVLRLARAIMRSDADGDDAAQEAWMSAWRSRDGFDPSMGFAGWIKVILKRACWRLMNPKRQHVETVDMETESEAVAKLSVPPTSGAAIDLEKTVAQIGALPTKQGQAVRDYFFEDMDTREIADRNGTSQQAASKSLRQGIEKLMEWWNK